MAIRKNILLSKIKVLNLQENKNALSSNLENKSPKRKCETAI